jgi:hypothetical protein
MVTRCAFLLVQTLAAANLLGAIQKQADDLDTEINESSTHTSEVIQKFIEDDISLVLVLLVATVLAVLAWMLCPFRSVCECEPPKGELDNPLMHEEMESSAQSLRRRMRSGFPLSA